jgi:acetylornithine/N-succinyldiaminopimelate aminotransferase
MTLFSESFFSDKRIEEAKKLILDALHDHQSRLTFSPQSKPDYSDSFQEKLNSFKALRGAGLWYPYISSGFGSGPLVELLDGSVKYDFISGIGVHFGHSLPLIVEASVNAALQDTVMQGHLQQGDSTRKLLDLLVTHSGLDHGVITTSGVMAVENALKITFQKKSPASRVLAFEHCFMGRTLSVCQITDKAAYRDGLPSSLSVDYLPFYDYKNPTESIKKCILKLKELLNRYPNQYAMMCFELIQGEGGYYPGSTEFFKAIMTLLKENGIAILVDEIQTFGRTESLFAYQTFELDEYVDIVTIGKLSQICATLYRKEFQPRPGLISQTFTGSTTAIETSLSLISSLINDGYLGKNGKIVRLSTYFRKKLEALSRTYSSDVSGPFGFGAMVAFTLGQGDKAASLAFSKALFNNGVIAFVAGNNPTRIRFLMPLGLLNTDDIDVVVDCIEITVRELHDDM